MTYKELMDLITVKLPTPDPQKFTVHRTHLDGNTTVQTYVREVTEGYGEDEPTQPGVSPAVEPEVFTKAERYIPCPRIVAAPMEKGTKCYLCARLLDYYFERSPGDLAKICSHCVWDHLRYEGIPDGDGALRRRLDEEPLR